MLQSYREQIHEKLKCMAQPWEFLFCSDPLRAPLLTRGRNGSQRDVAYVLPIHGKNVPELAGGTHVGGI